MINFRNRFQNQNQRMSKIALKFQNRNRTISITDLKSETENIIIIVIDLELWKVVYRLIEMTF